ncbi:penicillin-binding protein 2 [Patescibacteria group bacterium]|nr:penicillin-binding protein 2 [Patescibacteria group bacterium]
MAILIKKKQLVKYPGGSFCKLNKQGTADYRLIALSVFFILFFGLIVVRLFKVQVLEHNYYITLASDQHEIFRQLYPVRGNIFVQEKKGSLVSNSKYYPLATNKNMNLLYAIPKDIKDPDAVLEVLKEVFEIEESEEEPPGENEGVENADVNLTPEQLQQKKDDELIEKWRVQLAKENDPYEPLKHLASDEEMEKINSYNLEGITSIKEISRYYPEKNNGSQLLGFVGKQAENNMPVGYYGIEGCFNKTLSGEAGFLRSEMDNSGRWIAIAGKDFSKAKNGQDLVLTIDKSIQYFVCDELNKAVKDHLAENGSVIIMEPQTGKIIALCNSPDFDPNKYNEVEDIQVFNNLALTDTYEPGSVFKAITMAAALDSGKIDPFSGYEDTGEVVIGKDIIKNSDSKAHGWQTMTQVLEKSLNTGTVFVANKIGIDEFRRYVKAFGFGSKTGIDLCSEGEGNIGSLERGGEIYLATASFGQGLTTTALQLLKAYGAIANEGKLMEPYVIDSILDENGDVVKQNSPKIVGQVISPNSARLLGSMLVSVIKNGHGAKAGVPGYMVAAKTGTAQMADPVKGGYSEKTAHTLVGFAPYNNPRFVMVVKITAPKNDQFAETSAAPLFGKIAKFMLDYYDVPPDLQ